jgi:hypothetical protein
MQTISTYTGPDVDVQLPLSKVIYEKKGHHQGTYTAKPIIRRSPYSHHASSMGHQGDQLGLTLPSQQPSLTWSRQSISSSAR